MNVSKSVCEREREQEGERDKRKLLSERYGWQHKCRMDREKNKLLKVHKHHWTQIEMLQHTLPGEYSGFRGVGAGGGKAGTHIHAHTHPGSYHLITNSY